MGKGEREKKEKDEKSERNQKGKQSEAAFTWCWDDQPPPGGERDEKGTKTQKREMEKRKKNSTWGHVRGGGGLSWT